MNTEIQGFIETHSAFTTADFSDMLKSTSPNIGRSTIYYYLKLLCDENRIARTGKGRFSVTSKREYSFTPSETAKDIAIRIHDEYPLIDFQIWELYQMNEFVNHQISRNTLFVEVENMLDETVFNLLFEKYPHVLFNPDIDTYYRYTGDETIVVRRLITEAPPSIGEFHQASLEKILVDLFGRGLSGSILSRSEYPAIYEESFEKYNINQAKMFRYARRRNLEQTISDFIHEKTRIPMEGDQ